MLRSRAALPIARQSLASATRSSVPLKTLPAFVRAYSAESAAQTEETKAEPNAAYFKNLETQGVHPNLIQAITTDFGYSVMSPVQDKTIAPALKGTDMYVFHVQQALAIGLIPVLTPSTVLPKQRLVLERPSPSFFPCCSE
jgi:ATP-dependent RNA helicase MSS116